MGILKFVKNVKTIIGEKRKKAEQEDFDLLFLKTQGRSYNEYYDAEISRIKKQKRENYKL